MKTIAEILSEPATIEEIISKANEINEKLKEVDTMPELVHMPKGWDDDIPKWTELVWERGDLIDFDLDERESYYIMTAECNGVKYEGTGIYVHDTLEIVDNIEIVI